MYRLHIGEFCAQKQLYACTVISNVIPSEPWQLALAHPDRRRNGAGGWLEFRKANGRTWDARLLSLKDSEKDCVEPLHHAGVPAIKEGDIMITEVEISFRGAKSKPVHTPQTWWCVMHHEEGYAALDRHNPRSSTGFHVNDHDAED